MAPPHRSRDRRGGLEGKLGVPSLCKLQLLWQYPPAEPGAYKACCFPCCVMKRDLRGQQENFESILLIQTLALAGVEGMNGHE
jgi:hypothetical protein